MQGDNHRSERQGDSVRFSVRPESAAIFYVYDWLLWMVLLTPILMGLVIRGMTDADIMAAAFLAAPLSVLLILLMPGNRHRRRFAFEVQQGQVLIQRAKPGDGVNPAMLAGFGGEPIAVPRVQIREVVVRNTIAGRWSHALALGDLNAPNLTYVGVGAGGIAAAIGMAAAENAAAGIRRFRYNMTIGPRLKRSYYVALRVGKTEHVIGGGLDQQGAADLAQDVLNVLTATPRAAA